mgnify:CR=1 FL=1
MDKTTIINELTYKTARSSGSGGQHVNKVSSKVILSFNLIESKGLNNYEKRLLKKVLSSRITNAGVLSISCEESKSQYQNKDKAIKRFIKIITSGLIVPKKRIATRPTKGSKKRTFEAKKKRSEIKSTRRKPKLD